MRRIEELLDSIDKGSLDETLVARLRKSIDAEASIMNKPYGRAFRISSMTLESFEERVASSDYHTTSDFREKYEHHLGVMGVIALSAKLFLVKNWEQVKDWSGLNVLIEDNSGFSTAYYNHDLRRKRPEPQDGSITSKLFRRIDEGNAKRHNPITSITRVVLDTSDEDFSLTINGHDHLWISDESVIIIADYAERQIKKQNEAA